MMVANSFDSWQKDAFFSAAEEVQESADIMESAYRLWLRERRDGTTQSDFDELCRGLQTALSTAKWQLEEFERAVSLSYGYHGDDSTPARHRQFIAAIESQISRVEASLTEAVKEQGKQPLRWVNLDKEEHDDLAMFISGTSQSLQSVKYEHMDLGPSGKSSLWETHHNITGGRNITEEASGLTNITSDKERDSGHVIDIDGKDSPAQMDAVISQIDRTAGPRKTCGPPNFGTLKIVVSDEDEHKRNLLTIEDTPKDKGSKTVFWGQRCVENFKGKAPIYLYNKVAGRSNGHQRQMQYSVQLTLALMLSIFLIVTFVLYSS